jgi:non-canonical purine NTP pyrophosphatase (RdgB/HAM1 family)
MKKIVIASKNEHKVREIFQILDHSDLEILSLNAFGEIPDIEETGDTFLANARLKAQHYHDVLNLPVIADDSGLVVPALHGEPGIYSARYAGKQSDYLANNKKLLAKMNDLHHKQRAAYFICVMVYLDEHSEIVSEGRVDGIITDHPLGANGFGYDPIFYYPPYDQTFAQLISGKKNKISHRFRAIQNLKPRLNAYLTK